MASFEVFFDFNDEILEPYVGTHRITFVLGNYVAKDLIIEIHYIIQRSRKDKDSEVESYDNIFRLRVKHNLAKGLIFN